MNAFMANAITHWKSTLSGLLTLSLSTTTALLALPNIQTLVPAKTLMIMGGVQAVAKVWVSLIQQDAGVSVVTSPANPTPHAEASHEVPDAPQSTPVVLKP